MDRFLTEEQQMIVDIADRSPTSLLFHSGPSLMKSMSFRARF